MQQMTAVDPDPPFDLFDTGRWRLRLFSDYGEAS